MAAEKKARLDWQAVERDYRTGKFTSRELAEKHGCTHTAINKKAREHGWSQDLSKAIRQATDAKVIEAEVSKKVSSAVSKGFQKTVDSVLVAAEIGKDVILRHRSDIRSTRDLALKMLGELTAVTENQEAVETIFEAMALEMTPQQLVHAKRAYSNLVELPSRIGAVNKLADTLNKLQPLERKAFKLDAEEKDPADNSAPLADLSLAAAEAYARMVGLK